LTSGGTKGESATSVGTDSLNRGVKMKRKTGEKNEPSDRRP